MMPTSKEACEQFVRLHFDTALPLAAALRAVLDAYRIHAGAQQSSLAYETLLGATLRCSAPARPSGRTPGMRRPRAGPERRSRPRTREIHAPLIYQERELGELTLLFAADTPLPDDFERQLSIVAREISLLARRQELNTLIATRFGDDDLCSGVSNSLRHMDEFIERSSQSRLPVLLIAEHGLESVHVARALHLASNRREGPLLEVSPMHFSMESTRHRLSAALDECSGGTLLIKDMDQLERGQQIWLNGLIEHHIRPRATRLPAEHPTDVRLIATSGCDPAEPPHRDALLPALFHNIDFLRLQLTPLRQRREDIRPLVQAVLRKHTRAGAVAFSDEVLALFEQYEWPGNLLEPERSVCRLFTMAGVAAVSLDAVQALLPALRELAPAPPDAAATATDLAAAAPTTEWRGVPALLRDVASRLLRGEPLRDAFAARWHPALTRALEFIGLNYPEPIALETLAQHAHLSASHLSHLFKKTLGVSITPFINLIRILRASQVLQESPQLSITEVAGDVGYADLSYFERCFRRRFGISPREYRQRMLTGRQS